MIKYCSVCGKDISVLSSSTYLYKVHKPTVSYQCCERCWKIEKGLVKMIKISEKYVIEIGEHFTVAELKVVQSGKTAGKQTLVNLTYHYDIETALNEVLHRLTRDAVKTDEVITIRDVLHLLMKLRIDFIERKVKEIDIPREKRNLK